MHCGWHTIIFLRVEYVADIPPDQGKGTMNEVYIYIYIKLDIHVSMLHLRHFGAPDLPTSGAGFLLVIRLQHVFNPRSR